MNVLLPCLLRVRVADPERTTRRLWLPLFVLWPLLLGLLLLFLVAALFADGAVLAMRQRPGYCRLVIGVLATLRATRGSEISIEGEKRSIVVKIV